jgi:general secretion pathway protein J
MATPRKHLAGVTLIEIMIAVTILAIVSTLIYSGFSQTMRNKQRLEADAERYQGATQTLTRMVDELSAAYVSAQINPNISLQAMRSCFIGKDHGRTDRIDFTSFSHQRLYRDAHESDQNELSYFITRDPNDPTRNVLARREQARPDDDPQHGGEVQIALRDVNEMELSFLDPITREWVDKWDAGDTGGEMNRLPAQVKVILRMPGLRDRRHLQTFGTRAVVQIRYALNFAIYNP